jgi:hypothetical protein
MDFSGFFTCFALSTIGFCGFAFPSTATREGWPVNLHLASRFGHVLTGSLAIAGIAFAMYHGGVATAGVIVFVASLLTYATLRIAGWHAQRLVLAGELMILVWLIYSVSALLWLRHTLH